MPIAKELLFSCIIVMHVSFMALQPLEMVLLHQLEEIELAFCNLQDAEQHFFKLMFGKNLTEEDKSVLYNNLERPEGITLPPGNVTEIQASICAINDYLENHLPNITEALTNYPTEIIHNAREFHDQFQYALKDISRKPCKKRAFTTTHAYKQKEKGLSILFFSRRWVEQVTNTDPCVN